MSQSMRIAFLLAIAALAMPSQAAQSPVSPTPATAAPVAATPPAETPAAVPPPSSHGMVEVEFINPDDYSDINNGPFGLLRPPEVLAELNRYLVQMGEACLPAGTTLAVKVLNVRLAGVLAGERGHFRHPDARIMREADWPSMRVEWQLRDAQGATLGGARETISDTNYLSRASVYHRIEVKLPFEHTMLERWFAERICHGGA